MQSPRSRLRLFHWVLLKNPVDETGLTELATKIHGGDVTAIIRRLHFEACTFLMADMKSQVSSADPSEPVRKLPFVEKQNRL